MKLKSFGCSHIFGSELPDQKHTFYSNCTWPALLAKQMDLGYECYAWPGRGNLFIAEQVIKQIQQPGLFVINWTYIDRFDYSDPNTADPGWPGGTRDSWATCAPGSVTTASELYYKHLHSEFQDKLVSLMQIKLCLDLLIQNNRPFIMTYMDDLLFDQRWNTNAAMQYLQQQIKPHMLTFAGQNFLAYAQGQGHDMSANHHLSASGHKLCADYALEFLVDKIKTS